MKLLNLFSGTGSVSVPWRGAAHEVMNLDIDDSFKPEILQDILQWDYTNFIVILD